MMHALRFRPEFKMKTTKDRVLEAVAAGDITWKHRAGGMSYRWWTDERRSRELTFLERRALRQLLEECRVHSYPGALFRTGGFAPIGVSA